MEAAYNALDVSIYRALNDGPHFKAQNVDPKIIALSRQRKLCHDMVLIFVAQLLSWPAVSYRDIFSCYLHRFCRDICSCLVENQSFRVRFLRFSVFCEELGLYLKITWKHDPRECGF